MLITLYAKTWSQKEKQHFISKHNQNADQDVIIITIILNNIIIYFQ